MRYCTYRLIWIDGYGFGPEPIAYDHGSRIEASSFVDDDGIHLGYLTGDLDLGLIVDYDPTELDGEQAVAFARTIDGTAYMLDDGYIAVVVPEDGPE